MPFSLLFWILMLLWLVVDRWRDNWAFGPSFGGSFMLFILLVILGWRAFGAPVHP